MKNAIYNRALSFVLMMCLLVSLIPAVFAAETGTYSIEIQSPHNSIQVGQTITLTARISGGEDGEIPSGMTVNWSMEHAENVLRFDGATNALSVRVEAIGGVETTEQNPTITVQLLNSTAVVDSDSFEIEVIPAEPTQITMNPSESAEMEPGASRQFSVQVTPAENTPRIFTWSSSAPSIATVDAAESDTSYATVTSLNQPGRTTISARSGSLSASCEVTVRGITLTEEATVRQNQRSGRLTLTSYGADIERVVDQGGTVEWISSNDAVVTVDNGYLYGVSVGEATVTAVVQVGSNRYESNPCDVTVERNTADVITAEASAASPLRFSQISSQIQRECRDVLGSSLSYVSGLWVNTSQGTLYYRYQSEGDTGLGVGTGEYYYVSPGSSQRALSDLAFVPKSDFSGTAEITYTGYVNGTTFFQGTIQVDVEEAEDVAYSASEDKPLQFNASDFDLVCRNRTGRSLSYVRFDLPDEDDGTLYYRYISADNPGVRVDEDTQYRLGGSPSLGDVYFVPAEGTSGRVVIAYTGYNVNGDSFRGRLEIQVGKGSGDAGGGEVRYSISQGGRVTLDVDDFNDLSLDETGEDLDRVRFTLPASSRGTLYYNYTSGGSYDSRVTASRSYYADSFPYLDRVTFAANSSFTGTVEIDFTAWNMDNERFTGVLAIRVGNSSASRTISYTTSYNAHLTLDDQDFSDLCRSETDETLDYVQFELPSFAQGRLYYNYDDGEYDSDVSASRRYYRSQNPRLDRVTFVPAQGFSGSVSFSFTGRGSGGSSFSGTVSITVEEPPQATVIYYLADGGPVTFRAQDFRSACQARGIGELAYVRFTLPSSSYGRLYEGYASASQPGAAVSSVTNYYPGGTPSISQVAFVPKVGYQGTVTILYQGYDTQGTTYSGRVQIQVRPSTVSSYFSDLGSYSWAVPAVDFLYENGIVGGVGGGRYGPSLSVTRGDYVLMLCRAFDLPLGSGTPFWDVPEDRYYAQAVAGAQALGLVSGYADGGFHPNDPVSRQDAAVMLVRAMQADGWSFGAGQESLLLSFQDRGSIADYARSSMAILVEYGVLSGTTSTTLGPQQLVSRAEVAVMLANALTL